jgi:hypothetical protein
MSRSMPRHEDDEQPRPKKKKKKKPEPKRSGKPLLLAAAIGGSVLLLAGVATAAYFLTREKPATVQKRDEFPGMLAHWSFDDSSPGRDLTGHGNDAVLNGGSFAAGKKGKAFVCEGRDDQFMDLGQGKELNFYQDGAFTVAFWFQTKDDPGTIFSMRHTELPGQIDVFMRTNHVVGIVGDDTDDGTGPARHAFCWCHPANDGQWHHIALMRYTENDKGYIQIYYDGQLQDKDTHGAVRGKITTNLRTLGCERKFLLMEEKRFGRAGYKGAIDEVYIFNRALLQEDVLKLMQR